MGKVEQERPQPCPHPKLSHSKVRPPDTSLILRGFGLRDHAYGTQQRQVNVVARLTTSSGVLIFGVGAYTTHDRLPADSSSPSRPATPLLVDRPSMFHTGIIHDGPSTS